MRYGYPINIQISENTQVDCYKYWDIAMYTRVHLKAITGILGALF
jgi:hypothetical protein